MAYTSRDMRRFNHLLQETDAVYHEMAQHWGLSDSVMGVLYTLCDAGGRCRLRDICYWSGMTKQTVNSALRRMEGGRGRLSGGRRTGQGCLPDAGGGGPGPADRPVGHRGGKPGVRRLAQEDVEQYLALTRRFQEALAQKARKMKEES